MKKIALTFAAAAFLLTSTPAVAAARPSKPAAARVDHASATVLVVGARTTPSKPAAARSPGSRESLAALAMDAPSRPSKPAARLVALAR